jgi:hypothetical protein
MLQHGLSVTGRLLDFHHGVLHHGADDLRVTLEKTTQMLAELQVPRETMSIPRHKRQVFQWTLTKSSSNIKGAQKGDV